MPLPKKDKPLAEMILFISERSEGDDRFGAVKLNKILFYSDFYSYLLFGKPITGQDYQKLQNGPAPRRLLPVRKQLISDRSLAMRKVEYFNHHQDRTFALREPDLEIFSAPQIALVTKIIHDNWGKNGTEMSELSHRFHGWEDAEIGDTIPYEVAMLYNRKPTDRELERIKADDSKARSFLAGTAQVRNA